MWRSASASSPRTRQFASELPRYLDLPGVVVVDERTLRVPTLRPVGDPAALVCDEVTVARCLADEVVLLTDGRLDNQHTLSTVEVE